VRAAARATQVGFVVRAIPSWQETTVHANVFPVMLFFAQPPWHPLTPRFHNLPLSTLPYQYPGCNIGGAGLASVVGFATAQKRTCMSAAQILRRIPSLVGILCFERVR
jgi:hypothetical protein